MRTTVLALLALLQLSTNTAAATRLTEDFTELVRRAEWVVEVEVLHKVVLPNSSPTRTQTTLRIETVYKGEATGGAIVCEYIGGDTADGSLICPGQPDLNPGDRAVLLLARCAESTCWRVVGGDAGQIVVFQRDDGGAVLKRACNTFDYYVSDPDSASGFEAIRTQALERDTFECLLDAILSTGRPEILARMPAAGSASAAIDESWSSFSMPVVQSAVPSDFPPVAIVATALAAMLLVCLSVARAKNAIHQALER